MGRPSSATPRGGAQSVCLCLCRTGTYLTPGHLYAPFTVSATRQLRRPRDDCLPAVFSAVLSAKGPKPPQAVAPPESNRGQIPTSTGHPQFQKGPADMERGQYPKGHRNG